MYMKLFMNNPTYFALNPDKLSVIDVGMYG